MTSDRPRTVSDHENENSDVRVVSEFIPSPGKTGKTPADFPVAAYSLPLPEDPATGRPFVERRPPSSLTNGSTVHDPPNRNEEEEKSAAKKRYNDGRPLLMAEHDVDQAPAVDHNIASALTTASYLRFWQAFLANCYRNFLSPLLFEDDTRLLVVLARQRTELFQELLGFFGKVWAFVWPLEGARLDLLAAREGVLRKVGRWFGGRVPWLRSFLNRCP